jgi:2,4-dienoyl-CoA reductase-like NADH-dependent reductase (Old Yellow Enzyme family)
MNLAMSGAGLVTVEATGVERRGRITHGCVGLYSDHNEAAMTRVIDAARAVALPGTKFAIQLAHAGRKASCDLPWKGGRPLTAEQDAWTTVAPSATPFAADWHTPQALDEAGMARMREAFAQAARRAARIGYDAIELHMAHGYLMHEFCSPLSNRRADDFGGSRDNRLRFPLSVARAVAAALPPHMAWGARITGKDWVQGGWDVDDAIALAAALEEAGASFVCVSSGGNAPDARIPVGLGYQTHLATAVKRAVSLKVRAVGMIVTPQQADDLVAKGEADWVAIGRAMLDDPRWGWRAAEALGVEIARPPQYLRAAPKVWKGVTVPKGV